MTAETSRALLDPNTAAGRLRRSLVGDPAKPSDEYLLLQLLNSAQREGLEEFLTHPEAGHQIGADLVALVRSHLHRGQERERPVEYSIPVPGPVWDRYAQRARESHRRVSSVLVDALLRDDHRLRQGEEDALDAREAFRSQARELIAQLVAAKTALADHQARTQPDRGRLQKLEAAMEDLGRHAAAQGFALAALLTVLHEKGWVARPLLTALKARGWLTD